MTYLNRYLGRKLAEYLIISIEWDLYPMQNKDFLINSKSYFTKVIK